MCILSPGRLDGHSKALLVSGSTSKTLTWGMIQYLNISSLCFCEAPECSRQGADKSGIRPAEDICHSGPVGGQMAHSGAPQMVPDT